MLQIGMSADELHGYTNADDVIAHIERGRDEADRELPPRVP
jgi:hypothetical protein